MRIKTVRLIQFKRFDDLTIDLGPSPKKIVALVGPNGCGKSSVFDAFEEKLKDFRVRGDEGPDFYSKTKYSDDAEVRTQGYNRTRSILIDASPQSFQRNSFYIRTSYRFTPKLNVTQIAALPDIMSGGDEPISSIALDARLTANYSRLLGQTYQQWDLGDKTGRQVRQELLDRINSILKAVVDVQVESLGNVIENRGQLYFTKGTSKNFPYGNLSAGEKEVIDIVIDLIVKTNDYNDTVICIDEPELHLSTAIQRKLLIEIDKLIPDTCQLWVATHSIGFLRALQNDLKSKSQVLDFSSSNYFDGAKIIQPIQGTRADWHRIFQTALEDLSDLISPQVIVYCEGRDTPKASGEERGFDAKVYNRIFGQSHNDVLFVSSGGNTELDQRSEIAIRILSKALPTLKILVLKDRDTSSGRQTDRAVYLRENPDHHRMLKRFEIENYLFDKEVLKKYCLDSGTNFDEMAYDAYVTDIENQNIKDESSRIKNFCGINVSINSEVFKLNLAGFVTSETIVYQELKTCIF